MIKASSRAQIERLIGDLSNGSAVEREAATARLIVLGARAVEPLMALAADGRAPEDGRAASLRALEAIGDARGLGVAISLLGDTSPRIVSAAIGVARAFLKRSRGVTALDRLTALALDQTRPEAIRTEAVQALSDLGPTTLKPLRDALRNDPNPRVAALAGEPRDSEAAGADHTSVQAIIAAALGQGPLDDAIVLKHAITETGKTLALADLQRLVDRIREREGTEAEPARTAWMTARAAAHAALAARGSRLALYDLRETLEASTGPLPVEFVAALTSIGDASCLEAIGAAYTHGAGSRQEPGEWWRRHLAGAFRTILARERITRRHAIMRKILKRWPEVLETL